MKGSPMLVHLGNEPVGIDLLAPAPGEPEIVFFNGTNPPKAPRDLDVLRGVLQKALDCHYPRCRNVPVYGVGVATEMPGALGGQRYVLAVRPEPVRQICPEAYDHAVRQICLLAYGPEGLRRTEDLLDPPEVKRRLVKAVQEAYPSRSESAMRFAGASETGEIFNADVFEVVIPPVPAPQVFEYKGLKMRIKVEALQFNHASLYGYVLEVSYYHDAAHLEDRAPCDHLLERGLYLEPIGYSELQKLLDIARRDTSAPQLELDPTLRINPFYVNIVADVSWQEGKKVFAKLKEIID